MNRLLWLALAASLACAEPRTQAPRTPMTSTAPSPLAADAIAGVSSPDLRQLLADHWDWTMRWAPTYATTLGDHRFDDQLAPRDAASMARFQAERREFLQRARQIDAAALDEADGTTWAILVGGLEAEIAAEVCRFHEWSLSPRENPYEELSYRLGESPKLTSVDDGDNLVARMKQAAKQIDDATTNLRQGLSRGWVAPAETVRRTVEQLDLELAKADDQWVLTSPVTRIPADWPEPAKSGFAAAVRQIVAREIRPAVARYRDALVNEILPRARPATAEGLSGLPAGVACYQAMILVHLGTPRDAKELHQLGLEQVAASDGAIAELGKKVLGSTGLADTIDRLRSDRTLYFSSGPQMLEVAVGAVERANAALPRWFRTLPKAQCAVREIPAHEAPFTTIAYYRQPHYDGSKPGEYFVNTYQPETRPRFDFEALSWHEAIPGHHLQIAIAQELGALPLFRKLDGSTAYVEGWALYTERLADEMGLYSDDLSRLGMWSYDAWRSTRLVVDTGIHALGWSRAQAEAFMHEHTALTAENIKNEVDRYISTPGQALAYKVGQLEILKLRAAAEAALGQRFDIRGFHDVVLGAGAVTLPVLHARVHAWVASQGGAMAGG